MTMTPAINTATRAKIDFRIHEYDHDHRWASYGEEAAAKMGIDPDRVYKTLVVAADSETFCVGILPVSRRLDLKRFAKLLGAKKVSMAGKKDVERVTGYVLGGVSPLGQKRILPTIIDSSATGFETIFVSAGRRGLQIELSPGDLRSLTKGKFESIGK